MLATSEGVVVEMRRLRAAVGGQVVADVGSTVLANSFAAVAAFAAGAIVARWLGPAERGVFELGLFAANGAILVLGMGLNVPATVFVANDPRRGGWAFWAGVSATTVCALVAATMLLNSGVTGWLSRVGIGEQLAVAVILVFGGLQFTQLANAVLLGIGRIHQQNIVVAFRWALYLAAVIALAAAVPAHAATALAAYAAGPLVAATLAWAFVPRRLRPRFPVGVSAEDRRAVLWFGIRAQFANVFQFASYRFDVLLVGLWVGKAGLGVYAVGVMFSEALWLLPNAVGTVLLSHTSRFAREEADRRIGVVLRASLLVVMIGAVCLGLVAFAATRWYLGSLYSQVPAVTWLLLPGAIALSGSKILSNELVARGFPGIVTAIALAGALMTVVSDVAMIPRAGILGASIASTIGYSGSFVMTWIAFRRRAGVAPTVVRG